MTESRSRKSRKESLSALIDGETSEIEVHRLVREFREDDSLRRSWATYQHVRAVARSNSPRLGPRHHEALHCRISEAIEAEGRHDGAPAGKAAKIMSMMNGKRPSASALAASFAVAAALVVAVVVGFNASQQPAAVGTEIASPAEADSREMPELIELDEEKQRQLRDYLYQHDRMARMSNNAQLVNYQQADGER